MERGYQTCSYSMIVHNGYTCSGCKKYPITGTRWFCFTCRQNGTVFNYCSTCNIMNWHSHTLTAIKYSTGNHQEFGEWPDPENDPREPLGPISSSKK